MQELRTIYCFVRKAPNQKERRFFYHFGRLKAVQLPGPLAVCVANSNESSDNKGLKIQ